MSRFRRLTVQLLTLLILLSSIFLAVFLKKETSVSSEKKANEVKASEVKVSEVKENEVKNSEEKTDSNQALYELTQPYEERVFSLQTKFTFGLFQFVKDNGPSGEVSQFTKTLRTSMEESLISSHNQGKKIKQAKAESYYTKELIVADALRLTKAKTLLCEDTVYTNGFETEKFLEKIVKSICFPKEALILSNEEVSLGTKKLDWFFDIYSSEPDSKLNIKLGTSKTKDSFSKTFIKFGLGLILAFIVGGLSFILSIYFSYLLIFRKARLLFEKPIILSDYLLEIFFLYMLSMNVLPFLLFIPILKANVLASNVFLISSLLGLIAWPVLFKQSFSDVRTSIGAYFGGMRRFSQDFGIGVMAYITAIFPMLTILAVYSLFLTAFNVDINSGTHPIVPILTETKKGSTVFYIVILATVVAPIVEEFMFRGALYSWMRERMNAPLSILLNAFVFAAIHPQGAVGLVPLTCIGLVLATLREWRGNLTSCMIAHCCFNGGTILLAFNFLR